MSCCCPCHKCPYCNGTGRRYAIAWPWQTFPTYPHYPWWNGSVWMGTATTSLGSGGVSVINAQIKPPEPPDPTCTCKT